MSLSDVTHVTIPVLVVAAMIGSLCLQRVFIDLVDAVTVAAQQSEPPSAPRLTDSTQLQRDIPR